VEGFALRIITKALMVSGCSVAVLISGCVSGTENLNAANENRTVNPMAQQGTRPNVLSISMMANAASGSLKEGNWEQAIAALEEAMKRVEQSKNDPNAASLKPEFEEMEALIKEALNSARNQDQSAVAQVERMKVAANALVMRSQQIPQ
jgi:hypothetical protein